MQLRLIRVGIINVLCQLIGSDESLELKNEAILVASALLLGGNPQAQDEFSEFFEKDRKNLFIIKLHEIMEQKFNIIKKYSNHIMRNRE